MNYSTAPAPAGDPWYLQSSGAAVGGIGEKMDPMTLAMISAGSQVLGKALTPAAAGPSRAESGGYNIFDNSGFAVSFAGDVGGNSPGARGGNASAATAAGVNPLLIGVVILGGVLVFAIWAKKKH